VTTGNNHIGFIRVRKRKLKGDRNWRGYGERRGTTATASMSFDLVRGVRIDGKPRHKLVLGFGSLKSWQPESKLMWFWIEAVQAMVRHGIAEHQRQRYAAEMVRKGACLPTLAQCKEFEGAVSSYSMATALEEIRAIIKATAN